MSDELYRGPQRQRVSNNLKQNKQSKHPKASAARRVALAVGKAVRERNAYTHEVLEQQLKTVKLTKEDRAFATVLALGVSSCSGALDAIINRALRKPNDIKDDVRDALRISAYELFYLGKQEHAAVDQGVELVRCVAPRADKLANACLRKMVALKSEFPFGDPHKDIEALSMLFGFPVWLAKRLMCDLGTEAAIELMRASNEQAPLYISVNAAKAEEEVACAAFERAGASVTAQYYAGARIPGSFLVSPARVLQDAEIAQYLEKGCVFVSDVSAQIVAQIALPERFPKHFLEIGAGRGTKTMLLQSGALKKYSKQMDMVTLDLHAFKGRLLQKRAHSCGIKVKTSLACDARSISPAYMQEQNCGNEKGLFDAIFVDAPCSGLGTLRRHPEIRWRLQEHSIQDLANMSLEILKAASRCVAPEGQLVYSTCTVTKAENEELVLAFLGSEEGQDFHMIPLFGHASFYQSLRSNGPDAHFCVCFKRK